MLAGFESRIFVDFEDFECALQDKKKDSSALYHAGFLVQAFHHEVFGHRHYVRKRAYINSVTLVCVIPLNRRNNR